MADEHAAVEAATVVAAVTLPQVVQQVEAGERVSAALTDLHSPTDCGSAVAAAHRELVETMLDRGGQCSARRRRQAGSQP